MTEPLPPNDRIAVCLGASFLGFFVHTGFLQGLVDAGVAPARISGASAGAYVAGLYAAGIPPERIREIILDQRMVKAFWDWPSVLRGFPMLVNWRGFTGFLSGRHALAHLRNIVGDQRIEDCPTADLSISVSNLTQGRAEMIRRGPLADFITASWAVPGLFAGVRIDDNLYWDGGIADSNPVAQFLDDPAIDTIILHTADHPEHTDLAGHGAHLTISDGINVAHHIIQHRVHDLVAALAVERGKRIIHCRSNHRRPKFGDHSDRQQLIDVGAQTAKQFLGSAGFQPAGEGFQPEPR